MSYCLYADNASTAYEQNIYEFCQHTSAFINYFVRQILLLLFIYTSRTAYLYHRRHNNICFIPNAFCRATNKYF